MFTCPACHVKSISLFKKWKAFKYNIPKCSNCGSGYYSSPHTNTQVLWVTSIVYTLLILYCLFNLTWAVALVTFSIIIALEILMTSFIPLAAHQGQSERTMPSISFKELIAAVIGALLMLITVGGWILYPQYPVFKILFWILGILAISTPLILNKNKR